MSGLVSFFSSMFSPPKSAAPTLMAMPIAPTVAPVPKTTDPAVEEAAKKQRIAGQLAMGRASTLLTGGMGVAGAAPVKLKELLGQ